jgi:hypothetical protein
LRRRLLVERQATCLHPRKRNGRRALHGEAQRQPADHTPRDGPWSSAETGAPTRSLRSPRTKRGVNTGCPAVWFHCAQAEGRDARMSRAGRRGPGIRVVADMGRRHTVRAADIGRDTPRAPSREQEPAGAWRPYGWRSYPPAPSDVQFGRRSFIGLGSAVEGEPPQRLSLFASARGREAIRAGSQQPSVTGRSSRS